MSAKAIFRGALMTISVFDLFKVGIGPSSSHTVGPMLAAQLFATELQSANKLDSTVRLKVELYGSLGATGAGHGSDAAVLLGLEGQQPHSADPQAMPARLEQIRNQLKLRLLNQKTIGFNEKKDLLFKAGKCLPYHPNGLSFTAYNADGRELLSNNFYSVGGGFVITEETAHADQIQTDKTQVPYPFKSADQLLAHCSEAQLSVSQIMRTNESSWRSENEIHDGLLSIWQTMKECVKNGCKNEGILPGPLKVRRRAPELHRTLLERSELAARDPLALMDWVNLYALAVNEENAAGGRVVTAPTNGAAGIIPAVLHYYRRFIPDASELGVADFLLTAGAIGILYKENASISGAEVGCQGEIGTACSMAAGALTEIMGGTPAQVENAAEIGMEHNLGLTCDPVGGQVQIPCIERNAMGSIKAINASRMALSGDGQHYVSLDKVIKTMRETGADMQSKYKETSVGGLAVNVTEC